MATASVTGGREGKGATADGQLSVELRTPTELGGPGGGTNPEQLFAVGYGACFQSAMAVVARKERLDVSGSVVRSAVTLGLVDSEVYGLEVTLTISIAGMDKETVLRIVREADRLCPYSNAVRGNVAVKFVIE